MGVLTNFSFGVASFGVPTMGTAGIPPTSGSVWFVNSNTGLDGNTGSFLQPLKTTARAVVLAAAGDVIVWMSGHAETISAAGGITVNKAGLTFWGLGEGFLAPTFTSTTSTAATFLISSANTVIGGNVNTVCNIASQVTFFSVTAPQVSITATHFDTSASIGAITFATGTANNLSINVTYNGLTASTIGTAMISLAGVTNANLVIDAYGAWSTAIVNFITTACANIEVNGNFYNYNTAITKNVVDTVGGSTWVVSGFDGIGGVSFDGGSGKTPVSADVSAVSSQQEAGAVSANAGAMVTGATIFTIAGGPIAITAICSVCQTANGATASTLQYENITTLGSLTGTFSGASASLASAVAGTVVALNTAATPALTTAPVVGASGVGLSLSEPIICQAGTINIVVGVGSTTGTWKHYIRYKPLATGVTVS